MSKGHGGPGGVFLNPAGEGKGVRRRALIMHVDNWLRNWCWRQGFGFYDHETLFADQHLLGKDGIHFTKRGKAIFTNRMADLVKRALN